MTAPVRQRAEILAATLPPLLVAAERVAATVLQGVHGRRRVGPGETFWQFRRYQPGDAAQAIDWRQSAKNTPLYVREKEWAAAQSLWLWRDGSASMAWRSRADLAPKRDRAELLLLALAALLLNGGERVGLLGDPHPPATGRAVLRRLADSLAAPPHAATDQSGDGLPATAPLPRHGQVVLFGDFLAPLAETDAALRRLAAAGAGGHLVQILDPGEETLPYSGRLRFHGPEGEGETVVARTEDIRDAYRRRLAAHRDGLSALARAHGFTFIVHHTDTPPTTALLALHAAIGHRAW